MDLGLVEKLGLVEMLAHERSLMLAIVAHLPFPSLVWLDFLDKFLTRFEKPSNIHTQVALESASLQIYQLFSSYGGFPFHRVLSDGSSIVKMLNQNYVTQLCGRLCFVC